MRQVARRLLLAVPLVLAVSLATFLLSRLAGGSYFDQYKTDRRFAPAQLRALERAARLDEPILVQWLHWLRGVCFDVRVGRPARTVLGFEDVLAPDADFVVSDGVEVATTDEDSREGLRALRLRVPEGGGFVRLRGHVLRDSTARGTAPGTTYRIWVRERPGEPWRARPVELRDGTVELRFEQGGTPVVDALEAVAQNVAMSFGAPDFGRSFRYDVPVFGLLLPALANSFWLAVATLAVTWLVAIPAAVASARKPGGLADRTLAAIGFAGASVPGFFLALLVLYAAVELVNGAGGRTLLPIGADRSSGYEELSWPLRVLDRAWHLVLPVAVLSFGALAVVQRTLRASLLETLQSPFIASARAKGLRERRVVRRHALRNALNPLVTLFGIRLAELLSGAALVEIVFQYPGMGRLVLEATIGRDLYVVTGAVLLGGLMLVAANLLADLVLMALDPRVRSVGARA